MKSQLIFVALAATQLAVPVGAQPPAPYAIFKFYKEHAYTQTSLSTITLKNAVFYGQFVAAAESATGATLYIGTHAYPLPFPPPGRPMVGISLLPLTVPFTTIADLDAAFPRSGSGTLVLQSTAGQIATTVSLPLTPTFSITAPIDNFDALQQWDGGPLTVRLHSPIGIGLGTLAIAPTQNATSQNTSRVSVANDASEVTLTNVISNPGDAFVGTLTYGQGTVYNLTFEFPIQRLPLAPTISAQPAAAAVAAGAAVSFSVTAANGDLAYQWRRNGVDLAGATNSALTISSAQNSDAGSYSVVVANIVGSITSNTAQLTVTPAIVTPVVVAPVIASHPAAQNIINGSAVTLGVSATGTDLAYQWKRNGTALTGATGATLTLGSARFADAGDYTVTVSNSAGTITSNVAAVNVAAVNRLANISILTSIAAPGDSFTMGYVVGGANTSGAKPLVLRAAGPSLGALGVGGTLDDPKLELFAGANKTGENNDWGGAPDLANAMAGVGAFGYAGPGSRDAASVANLTTRDNSVKVSANDSGTGVVIAELYDATPSASFLSTTPRLINVSVLKQLGAGLTLGFVVNGSTPLRVLVRAVGPGLGVAPFNVPGVVSDPQLTVFGAGAIRVAENNDWAGSATLASAFAAVGAFGLPADSKDAAVLTSLAPGNYTVEVKGVGGAAGLALVEIYEFP
jgi:hypothetical protein